MRIEVSYLDSSNVICETAVALKIGGKGGTRGAQFMPAIPMTSVAQHWAVENIPGQGHWLGALRGEWLW